MCQDSTKLRLAAYMDDNLKGSNELCCISLFRASDDIFLDTYADVGVIIPVDPFEISLSDVTNPVQSLDHGEKKAVISDSANGHKDSSNINQINYQGHITTLNIGLIKCLDDNQTFEFIGDVQSLEQNNLISEETHEATKEEPINNYIEVNKTNLEEDKSNHLREVISCNVIDNETEIKSNNEPDNESCDNTDNEIDNGDDPNDDF